MSETDWTLSGELCSLADETDIRAAVFRLGLVEASDVPFRLEPDRRGWYRSGAETYLYRFRIIVHDSERELVLKACVAFSPCQSLEDILRSWVMRRKALAEAGVGTPRLFAAERGLVLEEAIPFRFPEVLERSPTDRTRLLVGIANVAGTVSRLGFKPVGLFSDLRSRGSDVVMVDFGQDLGPHLACEPAGCDLLSPLLAQLEAWSTQSSGKELDGLRRAYANARSAGQS